MSNEVIDGYLIYLYPKYDFIRNRAPHKRVSASCIYVMFCVCVFMFVRPPCSPTHLFTLPHPHGSTSHTLALGRTSSSRDLPAKSSSASSLEPNNSKAWQQPSSYYQSYSIHRRYLPEHRPANTHTHTPCPPCVFVFPTRIFSPFLLSGDLFAYGV